MPTRAFDVEQLPRTLYVIAEGLQLLILKMKMKTLL